MPRFSRFSWLLLPVACFVSCTPTPTPTGQQSGTSKILGLYELNLQGNTPSAPPLGSLGLTTSAHPLSFQRLSVSTINDSQTGTQYVRSLYRLTNTGTQTLTNLTFLPTNTDPDGSGTNPAATPTTGTTAFNRVLYFDGSDASSRATDLRAQQARIQITQNVSSPVVQIDRAATAFRRNLNLQGVQADFPSGLTGDIKPYGWLLSGALQPGQSAVIDFGASVYSTAQNPYSYDIVLTVATDDSSFTPTAVTSVIQEQAGSDPTNTVTPWTGGAGTIVDLSLSDFSGNENSYVLASGTVDGSGHLALNLASEREMTGLGGSYVGSPTQVAQNGCTSTMTSSDATLNTTGFENVAVQTSGSKTYIYPAQDYNSTTGKVTTGLYLYADRPATLNGTLTCGILVKTFANVSLSKGWNSLRQDLIGPNSTVSNGGFPTGWLALK